MTAILVGALLAASDCGAFCDAVAPADSVVKCNVLDEEIGGEYGLYGAISDST